MTTLELELETAMVEIRSRLDELEQRVQRLAGQAPLAPPPPEAISDDEQLVAWLRNQGLVRDPTPEELRLAAQWDALSDLPIIGCIAMLLFLCPQRCLSMPPT